PRRAADHRGRWEPATAPSADDTGPDSRPGRLRVPAPRPFVRPAATSSRRHPGPAPSSPTAPVRPACACSLGRRAMTAEPGWGRSRKPGDDEPSAVAPARLRRLNRWLVESPHDDLVALHGESRSTPPGYPS